MRAGPLATFNLRHIVRGYRKVRLAFGFFLYTILNFMCQKTRQKCRLGPDQKIRKIPDVFEPGDFQQSGACGKDKAITP